MKQKKTNILAILALLIVGLSILLYPLASNWLATRRAVSEIDTYEKDITAIAQDVRDAEWAKALSYNESLRGEPVKDPFIPGSGAALPTNYLEILNIEGIMAYIDIPKIEVKLPIYHGVSDQVLRRGVGHMEGTALPIGGQGSHTLLTGHTGLPSAKFFTDLIKMELKDYFYVHVLGELLVYEVDDIQVILPDDISMLSAAKGKDLITLITCTPYGVNSHRLLVRGRRVFPPASAQQIGAKGGDMLWIFLAIIVVSLLILLWLILLLQRRRKRQKKQEIRIYKKMYLAQRTWRKRVYD